MQLLHHGNSFLKMGRSEGQGQNNGDNKGQRSCLATTVESFLSEEHNVRDPIVQCSSVPASQKPCSLNSGLQGACYFTRQLLEAERKPWSPVLVYKEV